MRISDWSSDVCSSDLIGEAASFALFNNENIDRPACIHGQGKEADAGCVLIFPPQGFIIPVRDLRQRVIRHLVEQRGSHIGRTPWLARKLESTRTHAFPGARWEERRREDECVDRWR